MDSDEDSNTELQDDLEIAEGRSEKKRKAKVVKAREKVRLMPTSALMDLLPRRKKRAEMIDEFAILSTSEENREEDEEDTGNNGSADELSKGRTRSGRSTRKPAAKAKGKGKTSVATSGKGISAKEKGKGKTIAPAAVTKGVWSKSLSGRTGKTYARRSIGSEKENELSDKVRDHGNSENSRDAIVVADIEKTGRKKLRDQANKFKEVDKWELEFEDLSPRSLEVSDQSGR